MSGLNKVMLIGHLGRDAEVRFTSGGTAVANFSMATSETWNDKAGQKQEKTEWHKIVLWGKLAEALHDYLVKGKQVYLEGKLQTRKWTDRDGNDRYTTEVNAFSVQLLGAKGERRQATTAEETAEPVVDDGTVDQGTGELTEDDIPF